MKVYSVTIGAEEIRTHASYAALALKRALTHRKDAQVVDLPIMVHYLGEVKPTYTVYGRTEYLGQYKQYAGPFDRRRDAAKELGLLRVAYPRDMYPYAEFRIRRHSSTEY